MNAKTLKKHKFGEWISRWYAESELQKYKGMDWFNLRNPSGVSGFGAGFGSTVRRSHGISSSALAQFARSGRRPSNGNLPFDGYDYAACVRAMDTAPDFLEDSAQKALYYLFQWVISKARADGFRRGLAIGRKLGPKK